ncbi:MAG: dephospho-CoA kinase [Acidimicrobiia bacterium]|nr:MAG: dephospho-CoA kinase [Acidimicrobiia bacterium]
MLIGGGIGAGKSRVASLFARHGFSWISTDDVGRDVLAGGSRAVEAVRALWPSVVDGDAIDRAGLARIVFTDGAALAQLEAITHPEIERSVRDQIAQSSAPTVIEVPVTKVLQTDRYTRVAVVAPSDVRMARAVSRGGDVVDVRRRMASQPTDDDWRSWADVVVDNSGAWDETERWVCALIEEILADV